jgi:hypothetical protein
MARKAPWKKANPRKKAGKKSKKLSPSQKASANRSAKKAGRRYPSLVDNMRAASKKKKARKSLQETTGPPAWAARHLAWRCLQSVGAQRIAAELLE